MNKLELVYEAPLSAGKPRIVFIHGPDGHYRHTWMGNRRDENTLWPRWVGADTGCPVWVLGLGGARSRWKSDAMTLPLQAAAIIEGLSVHPDLAQGPLILVGHSLGGLLIKTALHEALSDEVVSHEKVARNIKGIVFVGTPQFGPALGSIAGWFRLLRGNIQDRNLEMDDADLEALDRHFLKYVGAHGIRTLVLRETQPVRLPSILGHILPGVTVVSPHSSQLHIPGVAGIPIEADHFSIARPQDRSAPVFASLVAFVREVEGDLDPLTGFGSRIGWKQSESMAPGAAVPVHLALAAFGVTGSGPCPEPVCATALVLTDSPERLSAALQALPETVARDPLLSAAARRRCQRATLAVLLDDPGAQAAALRQLAAVSFSAHVYHCSKADFDAMDPGQRILGMFVRPLVDLFGEGGERIEQVHSRLPECDEWLAAAAQDVFAAQGRHAPLPRSGASRYGVLEELAALLARVTATHLAHPGDTATKEMFEGLRPRLRHVENVAAGEANRRDDNPQS